MVHALIRQHEMEKVEASPMVASGASTEEPTQSDSSKTRSKPYDRKLKIKYSGDNKQLKDFHSRLQLVESRKKNWQVAESYRDARHQNADQENLTARQLLDTDVVQKFGYAQRNCKGITMTGGCASFVSAAMVRTLIKQHEQLKAIDKPEASDPNQTGSKPMIASGSSGSTEELRQPDSIKTRNKPYDRQLSIKYSGDDDEMKAFASRLEFGKSRKNKLQVIEKIRDASGNL